MKNYKILLILSISFLLFFTQSHLYAQNEYFFRQVSLKDGLPRSNVRSVHRDHKGYIWIGTNAGLCKYNSEQLYSYRNDADNPNSLPGDFINFITEDNNNTLWVGTNRGLVAYDEISDSFRSGATLERGQAMKAYLHLKDGVLFAEGSKLCKYDYATKRFSVLHIEGDSQLETTISLHHWKEGKILIGTRWNGLYIYDTAKSRIERADFHLDNNTSAYYVDQNNNIWLSPYGEGLLCYNSRGELTAHYNTNNSDIGYDIILDIESKDDSLWFATDGGGISILNLEDNSFSSIVNSPADKMSLPENSIQTLYRDEYNNMWAGSIRSGLIWIKDVFIKAYSDVSLGSEYGLSYKTVISILEDKDYGIWLGTDGGGVNLFDPKTKKFKHFKSSYSDKITSIENLSSQELVIAKFGEGLFTLNKRSGKIAPFLRQDSPKLRSIIRTNTALQIKRLEADDYLIIADSIYLLNRKTGQFKAATYNNINRLSSAKEYIKRKGNTIYLHDNRYILAYDYTRNDLNIVYDHSANQGVINSVYCDSHDTYWIGTTNGLVQYNHLNQQISNPIVEHEWFNNISIASLVVDKQNRLWIGAQNLYSYDIDNAQLTEYSQRDGVAIREFISRTRLVAQSGNIYLGGTLGLIRIENDIRPRVKPYGQVTLSEIMVDGVSVIDQVKRDGKSTINIPYDHNTIHIQTISHKEDIFYSDIEKYFINGVPTQESNHAIDLLYLSPNIYDITVSTRDSNGEWTEPEHIVSIHVITPWWGTIYAVLLFIAVLLTIVITTTVVIYRRRRRALRLAIAEQKFRISEKKMNFLVNISHELHTSITLIYAPLKRMLEENRYDPNFKQPLQKIFKHSKKVSHIINMVLDSKKVDYSVNKLDLGKHRLNEWLSACADEFRDEYKECNIEIELQLDSEIDEVVFDINKFDIAISNYLINALKHNKPDTTLTIKSEMVDEHVVRISVTDQGLGINEGELPYVFYQDNHEIIGTGIGLPYVKELLEMHNGRVGAYNNTDGSGATLYIEFNISELESIFASEQHKQLTMAIDDKLEQMQDVDISSLNIDTSSYSILIADNNNDLRQYMSEALSAKFKKVYQVRNGRDALDIINEKMPDVVISDVMMPRMDGYELCLAIKSNIDISHIPIILLSSSTAHNKKYIGYKMGADRYIEKPFDIETLEVAISNLLKTRTSLRERYNTVSHISEMNPAQSTFSSADERFMSKLNELIESNLDNTGLNTNLIVKELFISRTSLYNKLNSLVGLGVNEYINRIRVNKAATLLTTTDEPIQNIADMVGFNTQRYFSTVFKTLTNQSPSEYRRNRDKNPSESEKESSPENDE